MEEIQHGAPMKDIKQMTDEEFSRFLFLCAFSEMDEETITVINKETSRRWHVGVFGREPTCSNSCICKTEKP